jgi:dihydroorotase
MKGNMQSQSEMLESITGEKQEITIPRWFDRHLHLRDGDMMKTVLLCTLNQQTTGALIMPNLQPDPITAIEKARAYKTRIERAINAEVFNGRTNNRGFKPRMTLYLTDHISPEEVVEGFKQDAWCAVKLYMANQNGQGGTTGSHAGVRDLRGRYPVFEAMEKHRIPLLGHFEAVEEDTDEFDREIASIERDLLPMAKTFRGMPIVVGQG